MRLPWWGLILTSSDRRVLTELLESERRLTEVMRHPGWSDAESVALDWIERYTQEATRLGQRLEEHQGRMVLQEVDTPEDDRRRLLACAQAAALTGYLAELHQRANVSATFLKRQERERASEDAAPQAETEALV